jgi:hypothetical protein
MGIGKPTVDQVSNNFTRPADTSAYSANDLIANSTTAGSVVPLSFSISIGNGRGVKIVGARLSKTDETDVANSSIILHLWTASPTPANGDNGAFSTTGAGYIGKITFPTMTAFTDDAFAVMESGAVSGGFNPLQTYLRATDTIYGLLQAVAAYSPASAEVFTVTLTIEQF